MPTATAKPGTAVAEIKAFEVAADASYRVILVPQQGALTVTVTTRDGKSRSKTLPSAALESGKRYDMSVLVTNIDIELTLSGDISDWGDGGSLDGDDGGNSGGGEVSELEYGGEIYRTAKVGDRVWMAENLRYMPAGATIGTGVWYPENGLSEVAEKGLLYNYATATGGAAARAGVLRGICPEGWHIPTLAELDALVTAGPADGFFKCAGFWIVRGSVTNYGSADKGYLTSSEMADGRMSCLSYGTADDPATGTVPVEYGISVRCVKDQAAR